MRQKIDCFVPCASIAGAAHTIALLKECKTVQNIYLLVSEHTAYDNELPAECTYLIVKNLTSVSTVLSIEEACTAEYALMLLKPTPVDFQPAAIERMLRAIADSDAAMLYADHYEEKEGKTDKHPCIDYQEGSLRDDFDFGSMLLIRAELLHKYARASQDKDTHTPASTTCDFF